jgi:hypothetical protein
MSSPAKPLDLAKLLYDPAEHAEAIIGDVGGPLGGMGGGSGYLGGRFGHLGESGEPGGDSYNPLDHYDPADWFDLSTYYDGDAALDGIARSLAERYLRRDE